MKYQLRRTPLNGAPDCYDNNKNWSSTCGYYAATITGIDATTSLWQIPNKSNDAYKGATRYSYELSIIATDSLGNVSAPVSMVYRNAAL